MCSSRSRAVSARSPEPRRQDLPGGSLRPGPDRNKLKIIEAPSPSPQNTDPTNDKATAVANDRRPECPPGTVGNYPDCRDKPDGSTPECTDGRVRRGSTCVCPGSLVWNGDQCARRKCPEGMRGTFPQLQEGDGLSAEVQERDDRALAELREDREDLPRGDGRQRSELPENPDALPVRHERQAAALLSDRKAVPARHGRPAAELQAQTAEVAAAPESSRSRASAKGFAGVRTVCACASASIQTKADSRSLEKLMQNE